jgi:hypothetical protein
MWRHRSRMSAGTHLKNVGLVEPVCMDRGPKVSKSAVLSLVAKRSLIGCSCRLSPDLFLSHCTHNSYNLFINMRTPHSSFRSLEKNIPRRKNHHFILENLLSNIRITSFFPYNLIFSSVWKKAEQNVAETCLKN